MSSPISSRDPYRGVPNPPSVRIIPSEDPKHVLPVVVSYFPVPHGLVVKYAQEHYGYEPKEEDFPHMYPGSEVTPQAPLSWKPPSQMAPGEERDQPAAMSTRLTSSYLDPYDSASDDETPGRLSGAFKASLSISSAAASASDPVEIAKPAQEEEIPYLSPPKPRRPSEALARSYVSLPPLSGSEDANYLASMRAVEHAAKPAITSLEYD